MLICKCNSCGHETKDTSMLNPICQSCGSHDCVVVNSDDKRYNEADLIHHSLSGVGIHSRN